MCIARCRIHRIKYFFREIFSPKEFNQLRCGGRRRGEAFFQTQIIGRRKPRIYEENPIRLKWIFRSRRLSATLGMYKHLCDSVYATATALLASISRNSNSISRRSRINLPRRFRLQGIRTSVKVYERLRNNRLLSSLAPRRARLRLFRSRLTMQIFPLAWNNSRQ